MTLRGYMGDNVVGEKEHTYYGGVGDLIQGGGILALNRLFSILGGIGEASGI